MTQMLLNEEVQTDLPPPWRGKIRQGVPSGTSLSAIDASVPQGTTSESSATPDPAGQYQMLLAKNRSFTVGVTVPLSLGTVYARSPASVSMTGDMAVNFNIPLIRGSVQFYGNVNDGAGHYLADVTVTASCQSLTFAADVGFTGSTKTDIYGNYAILVPAGLNYQISFKPPLPKP